MMNPELDHRIALLAQNMTQLKNALHMISSDTRLILAAQYAAAGAVFDEQPFLRIDRQMKQMTGWFTVLSREIRYCINAMLMQKSGERVSPEHVRTAYQALVQAGFSRQQQTYIAAALCAEMSRSELGLLAEKAYTLYKLLKKKHPFLTNKNDVSLIVLLARLHESAAVLFEREERAYSYLHEHGFRACDDLQTLACFIAFLSQDHDMSLARKTVNIRAVAEAQHLHLRACCFPIYGILALLADEQSALQAAIHVYQSLKEMRLGRFIGKDLYFQTAVSLLVGAAFSSRDGQKAIDPSLLAMTDMIIRAQQAATAAAIAASAAAASAAGSSGN